MIVLSLQDLQSYHDFACRLARKSGKIAKSYFDQTILFKQKNDNSPVTEADIFINKLVIDECLGQFPDIGILGEEESSGEISELLWVCDPIDGTIPFTAGIPVSTFCLALVQDGVPVVGVVYDFNEDRLFSAIKGKGAWLNDKPLQNIAKLKPFTSANVDYWHSAKFDLSHVDKELFKYKWQTISLASFAYSAMPVALGRMLGSVNASNNPWDGAAVKVIVEECGGKLTDLDGNEQRYDEPIKGLLAAHPDYFDDLLAAISNAKK